MTPQSQAGPSKTKHKQATPSLKDPLGAQSAATARETSPPRLTGNQEKQVITLTALHSLATMPGRLPTTKDFPSKVKLSIVPRKYVSHTHHSTYILRPLHSPRVLWGERLSGSDIQTPSLRGLEASLMSPRVDPR
jgi:hypothetical protein